MIAILGPSPLTPILAVVEDGLAVEGELHLAVHATHVAQQDVIRLVVRRRSAVRDGVVVLVVPGANEQQVAHDDPACRRRPARLEDHGARQVTTRGGDHDVGRPQPKSAGISVQDRGEHAG